MNPSQWGKFMKKVLEFKNGGSIYVCEEGFLPVNITYEDAKKELQKLQPSEEQNLALFILAVWS